MIYFLVEITWRSFDIENEIAPGRKERRNNNIASYEKTKFFRINYQTRICLIQGSLFGSREVQRLGSKGTYGSKL
jgi:hypothetical protein